MGLIIFKNTKTINLFFTTNCPVSVDKTVSFNLILSPEFYWSKIFDIPLKNLKDVYKVIPSYFEDIIDISCYKFYVLPYKEKYLAIAYDEEKILHTLKTSNISLSSIKKIYFAQIEFLDTNFSYVPFEYDSKGYGYINDIFVQVPKQFITTPKTLDLQNIYHQKIAIS